jgi:hypothetical protein
MPVERKELRDLAATHGLGGGRDALAHVHRQLIDRDHVVLRVVGRAGEPFEERKRER